MRLQQLDLIRYGKFTDRSVAFKSAPEHDFHLVLGPNEAGKSTLRNAMLDLLFGFPVRTPLDFIHAKSELRLGAVLQHEAQTLAFLRLKANKNSLRASDESVLPDTALDAYLNGVSRSFFDKMFGLDHLRLTDGGNSILNAQDDVGQILFQSAAGLVSLGRVRDALQAEADSLWAPTRSTKRAYYVARADMEAADLALKQAVVHPRKWAEAHERVQELESAWQAQRHGLADLHARRGQLERIRRVGPVMRELKEYQRQQAELGNVISLASDAARILEQAQRDQAFAQHGLKERRARQQSLEQALAQICIDDTLLNLSAQIQALNIQRHQLSSYPAAIARYQGQLQQLAQQALQQFEELGVSEPLHHDASDDNHLLEQALRGKVPSLPLRKHIELLVRDYATQTQTLEVAQTALRERQAEADAVQAKLKGHPVPVVSSALREALDHVRALGDTATADHKIQQEIQQSRAALEQSQEALGSWKQLAGHLASTAWPSAQWVATLLAERRELLASVRSSAQRCDEQTAVADKARLRVRQYQEQHQPVMQEDLIRARHQRDQVWQAIKQGSRSVADAAEPFEVSLRDADLLADRRYDKAQEAAHMQSLQHQSEQADQDKLQADLKHDAARKALHEFDERWQHACTQLGLAGLDLEQMPDWLMRKDKVLQAERAVQLVEQEALQRQQALQTAQDRLAGALIDLAVIDASTVASASLQGLRSLAETYISEADAAAARHETWQTQAAQAGSALEAAHQNFKEAQARQVQWQQDWAEAMGKIGLAPDSSPGLAEGALALYASISDNLEQIRRLRTERLEPMQAELTALVEQAVQLAHASGTNCASRASMSWAEAFDVCEALSQRQLQASRAQEEAQKLKRALEQEQEEIRAAEQVEQLAHASIQPLFAKAGVNTLDALERAISKSDQYRELSQRIEQTHERLLQDSDGLDLAQLQEELESVDVSSLLTQLGSVQAEIDESTQKQSDLAVQLADAKRELQSIAGEDEAAQAESRRQDALARMGDVSERYIKVFTATRLLRWSIERYREEKQGPMLARASAIFAQLTQGSFAKLRVDFDRQPMVLEGQRADGRLVGIDGLSEGTRDQLYLALRLAALELHLQQTAALPFIADDLFINYDDARSEAGLRALADLSRQTQVIFLSHHESLLEPAQRVFGESLNVIRL